MNSTYVLSAVSLVFSVGAASVAIICCFACLAAVKRHGTSSLRAELDELRDAFEKNSLLLKRMNQRAVMRERRETSSPDDDDSAQHAGESSADWKRRMRARLITPGRPVKHG